MKNPVKVDDMFTPGRGGMMLFKCIECESEFAETWSHDLPEYKFCPICGQSSPALNSLRCTNER